MSKKCFIQIRHRSIHLRFQETELLKLSSIVNYINQNIVPVFTEMYIIFTRKSNICNRLITKVKKIAVTISNDLDNIQ